MFRGFCQVVLLGFTCKSTGISAFVSPVPFGGTNNGKVSSASLPTSHYNKIQSRQLSPTSTTLYENKLWDRLEIEEDPEPFWYLLNCVAGLEIDLLRQCREVCDEMPDAIKFVVPTEKKTRSHGANRMVTETKVKYQGYVFAKLRLCPEVYEAIQNLDLCRSWMGTVNRKGYRKLPPAPQALNELEIENFGLEDMEFEEEDDDEEDEDVIVDSAENDAKQKSKWQVDEEDLKVYLGLKVEDMVKVTKKNKFFGEDGIVRRLKDGKIMVRFFTYGSQFDEWLDPGDVRVLTNTEILKGLSGPSQPITQQDFDGPQQGGGGRGGDREWSTRNQPGNMRSNLMDNVKGARGPRNRRMDRDNRGDRFKRDFFGRTDREREQEEKNWKWYQENQRKKKGGGPDQGSAGDWNDEWEFKGGSERQGSDDDWALGDVDSQWGRPPSQRQKRKERKMAKNGGRGESRRLENAVGGDDDWSAFVTPDSSPKKSSSKAPDEDAFFASLMDDLSDETSSKKEDASTKSSKSKPKSKDDEDFFASLVDELSSDNSGSQNSVDDDFFAALEAEMGDAFSNDGGSSESGSDDDDFFAKLEAEMKPSSTSSGSGGGEDIDSTPDFFDTLDSTLDAELNESPTSSSADLSSDDFFSSLDTALDAELNDSPKSAPTYKEEAAEIAVKEVTSVKKATASKKVSTSSASSGSGDLSKMTVPVLKDMLRQRGLKVSGKKSELIERLQQS